jgi:hypothetical protein
MEASVLGHVIEASAYELPRPINVGYGSLADIKACISPCPLYP